MATDLEIARAARLQPIATIAERAGIPDGALIPYGRHKILWGRAAIRSAKLKVPNHTASEATDVQHR